MADDIAGELEEGIDPAAHGIPWRRAARLLADPDATDFAAVPASPSGACVASLLQRLRRGTVRAFGRPFGARLFRWITPAEWKRAPEFAGDVIRLEAVRLDDMHVHVPDGLRPDLARLAFGPESLAEAWLRFAAAGLDPGAGPIGWTERRGSLEEIKRADACDRALTATIVESLRTGELILSGVRQVYDNGLPISHEPWEGRRIIPAAQIEAVRLALFRDMVRGFLSNLDPGERGCDVWRILAPRIQQATPALHVPAQAAALPLLLDSRKSSKPSRSFATADAKFLDEMEAEIRASELKPFQAARRVVLRAWRADPRIIEGASEDAAIFRLARRYNERVAKPSIENG